MNEIAVLEVGREAVFVILKTAGPIMGTTAMPMVT